MASAVAENRSAADESGSELVSQVFSVLRASCVDLENAGAGGSSKSAAAAAAAVSDCADGGRYGCQVRHDEVSTAPRPPPVSSWALRLPPACAMSTAPPTRELCAPGFSGGTPVGLFVREAPRRQQRYRPPRMRANAERAATVEWVSRGFTAWRHREIESYLRCRL